LVMDFVDGSSLADLSDEQLTDELLLQLWREVDRLHSVGVAHRSLRTTNVMVDTESRPSIVDFSFSEVSASRRAIELDVAELLASLATRVGPDRAVNGALSGIGAPAVASAVPLLQPLALSAGTRRAVSRGDKLLATTRAAASAAGGVPEELASIRRVRARTFIMIALAAGAFYFILPQLAQVGSSFKAFQSAHWGWVPVIVFFSFLTYLSSAFGMIGTVPEHIPFAPILSVQLASSFVNRVSPANVGGMAANVRFLQKNGVQPAAAVSAVALNSIVGAVVHVVLIIVFFVWSGSDLANAFSLPSGSKILLILAVIAAAIGVLIITRWGRKTVLRPLAKGLRSAAANLAQVARSPSKLAMLFGGSAGVTLAYVGALTAAINAFGGGIPIAKIGAVYLAASALAAATPTPGGLGAIEAALVAGLTGVGMESGPAVSTVLTYRLATYWFPVLPGWAAWFYLQRKEYL
jgi:glycosyltransferase 2 family protein